MEGKENEFVLPITLPSPKFTIIVSQCFNNELEDYSDYTQCEKSSLVCGLYMGYSKDKSYAHAQPYIGRSNVWNAIFQEEA